MILRMLGAGVGSGADAVLPPLAFAVRDGEIAVAALRSTEQAVLAALVLSGRMRSTVGEVRHGPADGATDARLLRRAVALVDVPGLDEPHPELRVRAVVAEHLAALDLPSGRAAVADELERAGLAGAGDRRMHLLAPEDRLRLLTALASRDGEAEVLAVAAPQRHGGDPAVWIDALRVVADAGFGVAVFTDEPTAARLIALGARDGTELLPEPEPAADEPTEPDQQAGTRTPADTRTHTDTDTDTDTDRPAHAAGRIQDPR